MKIFVDYTSKKCFASARVVAPRLRNTTHTCKISFSRLVIQITIEAHPTCNLQIETSFVFGVSIDKTQFPQVNDF
jgi:hypothetical protein